MKRLPAILLLLLVSAALYLPSLSVPFYYDDFPHFVENPQILHPQSLSDVFRNGRQETRPLFNLSLALQAYFFGTSAVAAHAVNVLLFLGCGLLFYYLLCRLTGSSTLCFLAALVFLVHPMAVESVVYFNSRSGLLALLFSLWAWWALLHWNVVRFFWGPIFLVLAMASKEDAASAVAVAFLLMRRLEVREGPRWERWQKLLVLSTLLTLPLLYSVFRSPHIGTAGSEVEPWVLYVWHQGIYLPLHLARFFWPWPLTLNWDLPPGWFSMPAVSSGWMILLLLGFLFWKRRRSTEVLGWAWMFLALLPTHSVIPLLDVQATRISFFALPGFALLAAAGIASFLQRRKEIVFAGGVLLLLFFSWRTADQIRVWRNPIAMWEENVAAAPSRWRGWVSLATEYGHRRRWEDAWKAISRAAALESRHTAVLYNQALIAALRTDGRRDLALARQNLHKVLRINPQHTRAQTLLRQLDGSSLRSGAN